MHITPSQRSMLDAHRDRLARMASRSVENWRKPVDNPVSEPKNEENEAELPGFQKTALWDLINEARAAAGEPVLPEPPTVGRILRAVSKYYGLTTIDLCSQRRNTRVVRPRQVVMYLARTLTLLSLPQIGRALGGRDHTTVMHGFRKVSGLLPGDDALRSDIAEIKAALGVGEDAHGAN